MSMPIPRIRKSLIIIASLSIASIGSASAGTPLGPYAAYKLRIVALISTSTGAYVFFNGNHQCGGTRAYIDGGRADFRTVYSTLLAAQASGTSVSVDLRDTTTNGSCSGDASSIANICVGDDAGPCFTGW